MQHVVILLLNTCRTPCWPEGKWSCTYPNVWPSCSYKSHSRCPHNGPCLAALQVAFLDICKMSIWFYLLLLAPVACTHVIWFLDNVNLTRSFLPFVSTKRKWSCLILCVSTWICLVFADPKNHQSSWLCLVLAAASESTLTH
jgi:hypothetical protein